MVEPLIHGDVAIRGADAGSSSRRLVVPAALVSIAFLGTNALAYVFTVAAARILAPAASGERAALLGAPLVGGVPATGPQPAAALPLGAARGRRTVGAVPRLHAAAIVTGLVVVAAGIVVAPLV